MRSAWIFWQALIAAGLLISQSDTAASGAHVQKIFEGAAKDSPDGADFAETSGYRELVAALLELKPVDVAALHPVTFDCARAAAEPEALRGSWVSVRGYVMLKHAIALASPIGVQKKIERTIMKIDAEHRVVVDLVGDPPPFKNQADTMEVCGVFYRTVSYESSTGKTVTLPYVLARTMELVETPASGLGKSLISGGRQLFIGAFLGLIGVIVFVLYLRRADRSES